MKLNEKWMLFLIATFVTFFGITNTLLKKTAAIDDSVYFVFDDKVDIQNIKVGTTVGNLLDSIDVSGVVYIYDKNDNLIENVDIKLKTGDKIIINLSGEIFEYKISVSGDITGDGILDKNDISQISKYIINNEIITGDEYLMAADIDSNEKIDINDVIKVIKQVVTVKGL